MVDTTDYLIISVLLIALGAFFYVRYRRNMYSLFAALSQQNSDMRKKYAQDVIKDILAKQGIPVKSSQETVIINMCTLANLHGLAKINNFETLKHITDTAVILYSRPDIAGEKEAQVSKWLTTYYELEEEADKGLYVCTLLHEAIAADATIRIIEQVRICLKDLRDHKNDREYIRIVEQAKAALNNN